MLAVLVPVAFAGVMVWLVVRRGYQMKQLLEDGVETTGMVKALLRHTGHKNRMRSYRLKYAYLGGDGKAYEHVSLVSYDFWSAHQEGGPIAVVYSRSRPEISAPKHLVDRCRKG